MEREQTAFVVTRWGETAKVQADDYVQLVGLPRTWFKVLHISRPLPTKPNAAIDLADEFGREFRSVVDAIIDVRHAGAKPPKAA